MTSSVRPPTVVFVFYSLKFTDVNYEVASSNVDIAARKRHRKIEHIIPNSCSCFFL